MKARDVINRLMDVLPTHTDLVSEFISASAISISGSTVSVTSAGHGFVNSTGGDPPVVCFTNSQILNQIATAEDTEFDTQIITTSANNDLTEGFVETVTFKCISDPSLAGEYTVVCVDDDPTMFEIRGFDVPAVIPADLYLAEERDFSADGLFSINIIDDDNFSYELTYEQDGQEIPYSLDGLIIDTSTFRIHNEIRISGSASIERLLKHYDSHPPDELMVFVVLDDNVLSKNEETTSDNDVEQGNLNFWNGLLRTPFNIYVFNSLRDDQSGRMARDLMTDLRSALYKSLLGVFFPTGMSSDADSSTYPIGDGTHEYRDAYYVHQFQFAQVMRISGSDTAEGGKTSRFDKIDFDINREDGTLLIGGTVNFES